MRQNQENILKKTSFLWNSIPVKEMRCWVEFLKNLVYVKTDHSRDISLHHLSTSILFYSTPEGLDNYKTVNVRIHYALRMHNVRIHYTLFTIM